MKKIFIPVIITAFISVAGNGQEINEKTKIYNKDFKWTIAIPSGFDAVSAEEWTKMQNLGADAIEKTYEGKVENHATTIFVFKNDQYNYFESNYQPFDSTKDGNYFDNFTEANGVFYNTFKAQVEGAKLDSISYTTTIDGLVFQTFKLEINVADKLIINCLMYSRLFGNREFSVNIMTVDKQKEKQLLDSWKNSKFDR